MTKQSKSSCLICGDKQTVVLSQGQSNPRHICKPCNDKINATAIQPAKKD